MTPTPVPVALRAYTERRAPNTDTTTTPPAAPPRKRSARGDPRWPKHVLIFDTETTTDATQALIFGSYRVLREQSACGYVLIEEGLFYADTLPTENPEAFRELEAYAHARGLRLLSRREFVERVFWPVAYQQRGLVVCFNAPFDLSRIAVESGEARNKFRGGFSFALWDYQDKVTHEWREHPYRPRVCVKSLDSKRAFIGFTRPMTTGEDTGPTFRGNFLDVRTLAFALSDKGHSLASACEAFGVEHGKLAVEEHGRVTAEYIDYNRRDVLATQELLEKLHIEFDQLGLPLPPTRAYSPASIAKAYLRAFGIRAPGTKSPAITAAMMGQCMTAFYGGRAECRIRRTPVPVVLVDFRSMYPTVACLLGIWDMLIAERIGVEDCTEAFRALLERVTQAETLTPAFWREVGCFVEVEPDEDILPVRAKYSETRDGLNIGVNVLSSPHPMWYAGPDVVASKLLTGKPAKIRRAWRPVAEGVQADLKPVSLAGRPPIDPYTTDFFRTVIEERVRVKTGNEYSPAERARIAQLLKIIANSGSYGIFVEINRDELPTDETETVRIFGHGEPFDQATQAPEEGGEFYFPPFAALIVSGARLMLAMIEREITDRDGVYAFCDTDSMAIVATEYGGLYECEGGTADKSDRIAAVRALTWDDVRDIQTRINALNPYDRSIISDILNIEDVNFCDGVQRTLFAFVVSAKRYALYSWTDDRSFRIEKCSEHGLGHLMNPLPKGSDEKWPHILWILMLSEELKLPYELPSFLTYPAISRISVSTPKYFRGFLRRWADMPYGSRIKPYGFLIGAHVARFGHPENVDPKQFRLLAPFTGNPKEWDRQLWTDAYSGREFAISTALSCQPGVVRIRSLADILAEFLAHGEVKSLAPNGELAERNARGLLRRRHVTPSELRLIGKESNALEAAEAGLIGDWDSVLSTYGDRTSTNAPSLDMLMTAPAATLAQAWNVSIRTVRAWRRKSRETAARKE